MEARLHTWLVLLAVQVDAAEVAWQEHGTSTATWLADVVNLTRREVGRLIAAGQGLARLPAVAQAAGSGWNVSTAWRCAAGIWCSATTTARSTSTVPCRSVRPEGSSGSSTPTVPPSRGGIDRLDPHAEYVTPAMRRADALLATVNHHSQEGVAPSHSGDRPRIVITVAYDTLLKQCVDAGLVGTGDKTTASVARQLLCDADLLPAVLGGPSRSGRGPYPTPGHPRHPGRPRTPRMPAGCSPGCNTPPRDCDAHHLQPWWVGGLTALGNLALLCTHHHRILEPGPRPHHRPLEHPAQTRRDPPDHPATPSRPDPKTTPPRPLPHQTPWLWSGATSRD